MDVDADLERRIQAFESNDTAWLHIISYHTESRTQTNMHDNRSISSLDVKNFYCQPSNVVSYHGSAMYDVMIYAAEDHTTRTSGW